MESKNVKAKADAHKAIHIIKLNTTRLANRIGALRNNELLVVYEFIVDSEIINDETKAIMKDIVHFSEDTKSMEFKSSLKKLIGVLCRYYENDYKEIYSLVYCSRKI
jgi:DNA topoisomerase IA